MNKGYKEIFTVDFMLKLRKLHELLIQAYKDWELRSPDLHHKQSDGQVRVITSDHFFSYNDNIRPKIEIYSYVLGPYRNHEFDNIDIALEEVTKWHKNQLEMDYSSED